MHILTQNCANYNEFCKCKCKSLYIFKEAPKSNAPPTAFLPRIATKMIGCDCKVARFSIKKYPSRNAQNSGIHIRVNGPTHRTSSPQFKTAEKESNRPSIKRTATRSPLRHRRRRHRHPGNPGTPPAPIHARALPLPKPSRARPPASHGGHRGRGRDRVLLPLPAPQSQRRLLDGPRRRLALPLAGERSSGCGAF